MSNNEQSRGYSVSSALQPHDEHKKQINFLTHVRPSKLYAWLCCHVAGKRCYALHNTVKVLSTLYNPPQMQDQDNA